VHLEVVIIYGDFFAARVQSDIELSTIICNHYISRISVYRKDFFDLF